MSLTNDESESPHEFQQPTPALGGSQLQFRSTVPQSVPHRGSRLMLVILAVALVVPGGFLVWMKFHSQPPTPPAATTSQPRAAVANPTPAPAPPAVKPTPEPPPVPAPAPAIVSVPDSVLPVLARDTEPVGNDVLEVIAMPPKLRPAPLRLQGILFNETKPSAIINGRTIFVNSRINEFRVTSITASTVTLLGASETKVLELDRN